MRNSSIKPQVFVKPSLLPSTPAGASGHHQEGRSGKRGWVLESVAAQICLTVQSGAQCSPLIGGAQLAVDTTIVCKLHCNGQLRRREGVEDGVALTTVRQRKERTCPELVGPDARTSLVVVGVEMGGWWSEETRCFLSVHARAKSQGETWLMPESVVQAGRLRWRSLLAGEDAHVVAMSMLELPGARGADGRSYCKDHFAGLECNDVDQRKWLASISDWAEADPLHEKPRIQVVEVFAALAEVQAGRGSGGDQATVEMWQNLLVQLNLRVTFHFDRYLVRPDHMHQ